MFWSAAMSTRLPTYFAAIASSSSSLMNFDLSKTTLRRRKVCPPPGSLIAGARCGPITEGPCCFGGAACCSNRCRCRSMSWLMTPGLTCGEVWACAWTINRAATAKPSVSGTIRIEDRAQSLDGRSSTNRLGGMMLLTIRKRCEVGAVELFGRGSVDILRPLAAIPGYQEAFDVHGGAVADDLDRTV